MSGLSCKLQRHVGNFPSYPGNNRGHYRKVRQEKSACPRKAPHTIVRDRQKNIHFICMYANELRKGVKRGFPFSPPAESINSGDSRRIFIISLQAPWREHVKTVVSLLLMPVVFAGTERIAGVDRPVFPAPTARSRSVGQMR